MTTEEIVKSLRHCATVDGSGCFECPARSEFDCEVLMKADAADLIERLEKEKAALLKALRACSWVCRTFPDHAPATGFSTSALHDYAQTAFSEVAGSGKEWRTTMKRLTQRIKTGEVLMASEYEEKYTTEEWICVLQDRLAAYEDTGMTPKEVAALGELFDYALKESKTLTEQLTLLKHIRELAEADKEGRVVVLPCKVGDTVYRLQYVEQTPGRFTVGVVPIKFALIWLEEFGKTVFLTREGGEKALEARKDG